MGIHGSSWEAVGYGGAGNVRRLIGSLRGRPAVVCGNAESVFDDLVEVCTRLHEPVIFAVNDIGMYLDRLDHWVTLHADHMPAWKTVRALYRSDGCETHSIDLKAGVQWHWEKLNPLFLLSGYFAMQIAWIMGAEWIILCGCPGTCTRRWFEAEPRHDFGYGAGSNEIDKAVRGQLEREMARVPEFKKVVRSMSGWTQQYFGGL